MDQSDIVRKIYVLFKSRIGDDEISKEDIKFYLRTRSDLSLAEMAKFKDKLSEYSSVFSEVVSELSGDTSFQDVFDATYFYNEVLGAHKSTFNSWKKRGFFKGADGSRNQKVTLDEIEEFLNIRAYRKYRKIWDNR